MYYLTDTGYAWDGGRFAIRDVVESGFGLSFHSTKQIVECVNKGEFPETALVLAHTLWSDSCFQWNYLHIREFFRNRVKLAAKKHKGLAKCYDKMVTWYWKKM